MKPAIEARCLRHAAALAELFPNATKSGLDLCRALRRIEAKVSRASVAYCNGDLREDQWCAEKCRASGSLIKLFHPSVKALDALRINGDPRGYALKLDDAFTREHNRTAKTPIHTDWGGYGTLAPDLTEE
jgi:hypothetical protein